MFIKKELKDNLCIVTVDREEALNAMNPTVLNELYDNIDASINDKNIGAIIITGSGDKAFIAGADIKLMGKLDKKGGREFGEQGQKVTNLIEESSKPVIAALNGFALGGGCEIALACHLRFASTNAKFGQPEVKLGLIPGWGGTQRLPKIVGKGNAIELIIGGHIIDSNEALRIGLVNKVFDQDKLLDEAISFAKIITANGPFAVSQSLKCINDSSNYSLVEGLKKEVEQFSDLFESQETNEGLKAFVEKRKANFR
jgi:enoyl-CoA hydratase